MPVTTSSGTGLAGWKRGPWTGNRAGRGTRSPYSSPRELLNATSVAGAGTRFCAQLCTIVMTDNLNGLRAPCEAKNRSHMEAVQAHPGCTSTRSGPSGGPSACRFKEDMPCELSILLPSIVRPSASTGCSLFDQAGGMTARPGYPPYNIERTGENDYRITVAVAGFGESRAHRSRSKENTLTIRGEKQAKTDEHKGEMLYQGIAARAFERVFQLADYVQVKGAALENGLLHVDLVREIPEAKKPRQITIGNGTAQGGRAEGCVSSRSRLPIERERPGMPGRFHFARVCRSRAQSSGATGTICVSVGAGFAGAALGAAGRAAPQPALRLQATSSAGALAPVPAQRRRSLRSPPSRAAGAVTAYGPDASAPSRWHRARPPGSGCVTAPVPAGGARGARRTRRRRWRPQIGRCRAVGRRWRRDIVLRRRCRNEARAAAPDDTQSADRAPALRARSVRCWRGPRPAAGRPCCRRRAPHTAEGPARGLRERPQSRRADGHQNFARRQPAKVVHAAVGRHGRRGSR